MEQTYICFSQNENIVFKDQYEQSEISLLEFEKSIPRRQRQKISMTAKMALALFKKYNLNEKLTAIGANPKNIPLIICNRYANWDFVSEEMVPDIEITLKNINNYVATAWFPASIQGFLTIEYNNIGEAITLATTDTEIISAAAESFLSKKDNTAIILGTFECFPKKIANQEILEESSFAFGALSILTKNRNLESILSTINFHQELYKK